MLTTFLAGEVGLLVAQGAEVVGTAGNKHFEMGAQSVRTAPGLGEHQQAQQLASECLSVRFGELDQHLVQAVEDRDRPPSDPAVHIFEQELAASGVLLPASVHALLKDVGQARHGAVQAGQVPQVEIQGQWASRVAPALPV